MAFRLNEFIAEINKTGIARPSYFMVMITLPTALTTEFPEFGRSMQFRVESASLPTRTILTHDQRYYGPIRRIPYGFASMDLTMSVILSEDMREREVFMRWQDLLVGQSRTRKDGMGKFPTAVFDAGYYEDGIAGASVELRTYATSPAMQNAAGAPRRTILGEVEEIARSLGYDPSLLTRPYGFNLFGDQDQNIDASYTVELVEPFPTVVNEVPLSWSEDGYARLNVAIQYRYTKEVSRFAAYPRENGSVAGLLRTGLNTFNRFEPTIALIRREGVGGALENIGESIARNAFG